MTINFTTDTSTVAYTVFSTQTITLGATYFRNNPSDVGAIVHESAHVMQGYTTNGPPSWVTEGIADWARYYMYRDQTVAKPSPTSNYTDGYRSTAYFFNWIRDTYDKPTFVRELNIASHDGTYTTDFFFGQTGKTVDQLWQEMMAQ